MLPKDQSLLMVKAFISRFLILLLGIAFCGGQYASLVGSSAEDCLPKSGSFIISANHLSHVPFRSTFVSEPMSEEEVSSESETEQGFDIAWCDLFAVFSFESSIELSPVVNLFHQLEESIQNRFTASLFVLHHSWKNALS